MKKIIAEALRAAGDFGVIENIRKVSGGDINESYFVQTENQTYFLKYNLEAPEDFFRLEAEGLQLIRDTNTVRVPKVFAYSENSNEGFLIMEWVNGKKDDNTEKLLGQKLAALHKSHFVYHGYSKNTYIGTLPQRNRLMSSWLEYYRDYRLSGQMEIGIKKNYIRGERGKRLETLLNRLHEWFPANVEASLLHGDLWGGNWIVGPNGEPFLIDPSVMYGDRHFEIAFTELFGGFTSDFYRAYEEYYPLSERYEEIKPLYQLYYLLVHLNLFGESYGGAVDRILKMYV
ncbi:fructosamine kinase family protein [Aeribacillus composti]|uniref:fructosamine kinase family protein n=1 Tax=Aeribacillus composti TaxID=1868734 RepID=UPI003D23F4F3